MHQAEHLAVVLHCGRVAVPDCEHRCFQFLLGQWFYIADVRLIKMADFREVDVLGKPIFVCFEKPTLDVLVP